MKKAFDFYRKDTAYRIMKKDWSARYGKETVEIIWATASANLDRLYKQFDSVPDGRAFMYMMKYCHA